MEQRFCTKCGARLREGAAFCSRCGAKVGTAEPEKEKTVMLVDEAPVIESNIRRGNLLLTDAEKSLGATKVLDFGTGTKFSVRIPGGVRSGSRIRVRNTGIIDPASGLECEIELTIK